MEKRLVGPAALLLAAGTLAAQEPPEIVRTHCRDEDPKNRCPGPDCLCTDDALEVTFHGVSGSVLERNVSDGDARGKPSRGAGT